MLDGLRPVDYGAFTENTVDSLGMSFGTSVPNVGGARRDWSNVVVDGVIANEVGNSGPMAQPINLDAVAEVKILLNSYRAECGRAGGGQFQIVSKGRHFDLPRGRSGSSSELRWSAPGGSLCLASGCSAIRFIF